MLNNNKIESLLNADEKTKPQIAEELGIKKQTIYSKIDRNNWNFKEIEFLADRYGKSMDYFFDREREKELDIVSEDSPPYCSECASKQKEIERLNNKIQEVYGKYTELLESKNTNARNCV